MKAPAAPVYAVRHILEGKSVLPWAKPACLKIQHLFFYCNDVMLKCSHVSSSVFVLWMVYTCTKSRCYKRFIWRAINICLRIEQHIDTSILRKKWREKKSKKRKRGYRVRKQMWKYPVSSPRWTLVCAYAGKYALRLKYLVVIRKQMRL